jgi:hypothetical protein
MLASLPEIYAFTGTIECDFPLLAAALRADPSMKGRAEALLSSGFADGAGQIRGLL